MIPTARLWTALCLLALPAIVAGFFTPLWTVLLGLDGVLIGLAAFDFWVARSALVTVEREPPTKLSVGVSNKIVLRVRNRGAGRAQLELKDDAPEQMSVDPDRLLVTLDPGTQARPFYLATPLHRGSFSFGDLHLRARGPLGLVLHNRTVAAASAVAVYPDLRGARRLLLATSTLDLVNLGLRQLRRDGRGSEFARLRDYAQGDSVREVDWKATARRGKPVTRILESERSQSVLICVDAGRAMAAQVEGLSKLDHSVSAALFLAFVAVRNGDRVGIAVFADGVKAYVPPAAGRLQYRRIVDALYAARPQLTYVDYDALFRELATRLVRRSMICIFTDLLESEQAAALAVPLQRLAQRHVPLCLSIQDTALLKLLRTVPENPEVAFQHAAASELLAEREQMRSAINREGVHLIDVHPDALSLAAVNRYLEIKARGVL